MKNVLIIATAVLLSTTVHAEDDIVNPEAINAGQEAISNSAPTETGAIAEDAATTELSQVANEANSTELWKTLDVNEDGSISKEESVSSKEVVDSWKDLDVNKDDQLDSEEFAQMFPSEK
jgi:hypothetical protein